MLSGRPGSAPLLATFVISCVLWSACNAVPPLELTTDQAASRLGDRDGDGWRACPPGSGADEICDCDDASPDVHPGQPDDQCDGIDKDCDLAVDEDSAFAPYFRDRDQDGYGDDSEGAAVQIRCTDDTSGYYVSLGGDCSDRDPDVHPGQEEACDEIDHDCDGDAYNGLAFTLYAVDRDQDGYWDGTSSLLSDCQEPDGYVPCPDGDCGSIDCDDGDRAVHPGAGEQCNGVDDDCNEEIDDAVTFTAYGRDLDGDGFWDGDEPSVRVTCDDPPDSTYVRCEAGACGVPIDCDDDDASVYPGAPDLCNGRDDNCDGSVDEELVYKAYVLDDDGDGFPDTSDAVFDCAHPGPGYITCGDAGCPPEVDCDDAEVSVFPGAIEGCDGVDNDCDGETDEGVLLTCFRDADGDGSGDGGAGLEACAPPGGYVNDATDCDDTDPDTGPTAQEVCDGKDNDCDGECDEGLEVHTYFNDGDADGYGTGHPVSHCDPPPAGYVTEDGDCDDANLARHPNATESCDSQIDLNCDGRTGNQDHDGDGFKACASGCGAKSGDGTPNPACTHDCDDDEAVAYPGALEVCDGVDNDCNGETDDAPDDYQRLWYRDSDGDGYGSRASDGYLVEDGCRDPSTAGVSYVLVTGDCDDQGAGSHPGAAELCDGVDNDCDGLRDEGYTALTWYRDADGDGYGVSSDQASACYQPTGYASQPGDCDDEDAAAYPGALESCGSDMDLNCDGVVGDPTGGGDQDRDGYVYCDDCSDNDVEVHPDAEEVCDGVDNDCNGVIDGQVEGAWYPDRDGDGQGDRSQPSTVLVGCSFRGWSQNDLDCDDSTVAIHAGAQEVCDGKDSDCDGALLDGETDLDGDHYLGCATDCDDQNASVNPGVAEVCGNAVDEDCSGIIDDLDADGDGHRTARDSCGGDDCDDNASLIHPGATEVCDGMDNDCDGAVDDADPSVIDQRVYYLDADGDGVGSATPVKSCASTAPAGATISSVDCDDSNAAIYPGATERCDAWDNDCDGEYDEGAVDMTLLFRDRDGDGYGAGEGEVRCQAPGYVDIGDDCNDDDAFIHPGADEPCDGVDNDCDGEVDQNHDTEWYPDMDGDGYGDQSAGPELTCGPIEYMAPRAGDCDDEDSAVHPGATELCDSEDNDCDGGTDEGVQITYYEDGDGDGFGDPTLTTEACALPEGYSDSGGDCDDLNPDVNPDAVEICNSTDDDCDGSVDDNAEDAGTFYRDSDGDGFGDSYTSVASCETPAGYVTDANDCDDTRADIHPGAEELEDGVDDDCDGSSEADRHCTVDGASPENGKPVYTSIQAAIDAASDGERIAVWPGDYFEHLDFKGKAIHVYSVSGAEETRIHAVGSGSVVVFHSHEGEDSLLRGVTLMGGSGSSASICGLTDDGSRYGGGLCVTDAAPQLEDLIVTGNNADYGGGVYVLRDAGLRTAGLRITTNVADQYGGGVYLRDTSSEMIFDGLVVSDNSAPSGGGLVFFNSNAILVNLHLIGNTASAVSGGGAYVTGVSSPSINQLVVSCNHAFSRGGGIYFTAWDVDSQIQLSHVLIEDNEAAYGGAIAVDDGGTVTLENGLLVDNEATSGGGALYLRAAEAILEQTTVTNNVASYGGGVMVEYGAGDAPVLTLTDTILAFNTASSSGDNLKGTSVDTSSWSYNLFYTSNETAGLVGAASEGSNYLVADPGFLGTDTIDYHLQSDSPAVNAGDGSLELQDPDGSTRDLGAYGGPGAGGWDLNANGVPGYYWPGGYEYPPEAVEPDAFEQEDLDPEVWSCQP